MEGTKNEGRGKDEIKRGGEEKRGMKQRNSEGRREDKQGEKNAGWR